MVLKPDFIKTPHLNVLVVGGAGFIGSHMVKKLLSQDNINVFVIDNLSTGHQDAVLTPHFFHIDLSNKDTLNDFFQQHPIDIVMHFASSIVVSESVKKPADYYENNVVNTFYLLNAMKKHGVNRFIFSSTAAVYGDPQYTPLDLAHPTHPINPYGRSKLMIEQMLDDFSRAYDFHYITLRYFNAAGADPNGELGERHEPETHLIPRILQAVLKRQPVHIYGNDYDTPDATAIRDYIHIDDLCTAHLNALRKLLHPPTNPCIFNLGSEKGFSVNEVIQVAKKVTGVFIDTRFYPRREGDAPILVADATLAKRELNWAPIYSLEDIIRDAWRFYQTAHIVGNIE